MENTDGIHVCIRMENTATIPGLETKHVGWLTKDITRQKNLIHSPWILHAQRTPTKQLRGAQSEKGSRSAMSGRQGMQDEAVPPAAKRTDTYEPNVAPHKRVVAIASVKMISENTWIRATIIQAPSLKASGRDGIPNRILAYSSITAEDPW